MTIMGVVLKSLEITYNINVKHNLQRERMNWFCISWYGKNISFSSSLHLHLEETDSANVVISLLPHSSNHVMI